MKESNKFAISKTNVFIGKGFISDGLIWLNIINPTDNKVDISVALNIESCDIWHEKLWHVNFNSITKMINLNLIPKSSFDSSSKCEIYVQTCRNTVSFNQKEFWTLELIHSDVCDSNKVLTRGNKRYFMTFIDDYFKFCFTYLLKSKDKILDWFKVYKAEVENRLERKIKIVWSGRGGVYLKWYDKILPRVRYYSWGNYSLYTTV